MIVVRKFSPNVNNAIMITPYPINSDRKEIKDFQKHDMIVKSYLSVVEYCQIFKTFLIQKPFFFTIRFTLQKAYWPLEIGFTLMASLYGQEGEDNG